VTTEVTVPTGVGDPATAKVRLRLPSGWTDVPPDQWRKNPRWLAPDGITTLSLELAPAFGNFVIEAAEHFASQVSGFATPPGVAEVREEGVVGDELDGYALHWVNAQAEGAAWTHRLAVLRDADFGGPHQLRCELVTDEAGAAVLIEPVRAACAAAEWLD
jgi:hypothetical protein